MRAQSLFALFVSACGGASHPAVDATGGDALGDAVGIDVPDTRDPANDGDATVTTTTVSIPGSAAGRTLPATVFTPDTAGSRALVVVSAGFQMDRTQYASYARHLATWGFVVVLPDYADRGFFPNHQLLADDVSSVIDWALAQPLVIDPQRVAAAGHSLGGKISVLAASADSRIKAIVAWDPVDSNNPSVAPQELTGLAAAVAVVGETTNATGGGMPCAPAAENFEQFYTAAPSPTLAITVKGADHMDWVDDPSCTLCGLCTAGTADPELARRVSRRLGVAWLRRHLDADMAMEPWLAMPPELASGTIELDRR